MDGEEEEDVAEAGRRRVVEDRLFNVQLHLVEEEVFTLDLGGARHI